MFPFTLYLNWINDKRTKQKNAIIVKVSRFKHFNREIKHGAQSPACLSGNYIASFAKEVILDHCT